MQFRYTILYVRDVAATLDHYERAYGARRRFLHESGDFGELDTGETRLAFSSFALMSQLGKSPRRADPDSPDFEIAFETEDVEAAFRKAIANGAVEKSAPERQPWGQTVAYVTDPNGFLVEICTPVGSQS